MDVFQCVAFDDNQSGHMRYGGRHLLIRKQANGIEIPAIDRSEKAVRCCRLRFGSEGYYGVHYAGIPPRGSIGGHVFA